MATNPSQQKSLQTSAILDQVIADLETDPPVYTSPSQLIKKIPGINAQMVAQACTRYLTPQQKTLRKSLQPVGRKWIDHERE